MASVDGPWELLPFLLAFLMRPTVYRPLVASRFHLSTNNRSKKPQANVFLARPS